MASNPTVSPEQALALIENLLQNAPPFDPQDDLSGEDLKWLGRGEAILDATGSLNELISFRVARANLGTALHDRSALLGCLHTAYSKAELKAPSVAQDAFIPKGDTWNGYAAIVKLLGRECKNVLVVDPYVDSGLFVEFAPHVRSTEGLRCLTAKHKDYHDALVASSLRWNKDKPHGPSAQVRYTNKKALHDRLIIFDKNEVWLVSQSLKDIADRSPASVSRADTDLGLRKAEYWDEMWDQGAPII